MCTCMCDCVYVMSVCMNVCVCICVDMCLCVCVCQHPAPPLFLSGLPYRVQPLPHSHSCWNFSFDLCTLAMQPSSTGWAVHCCQPPVAIHELPVTDFPGLKGQYWVNCPLKWLWAATSSSRMLLSPRSPAACLGVMLGDSTLMGDIG